VPANAVADSFEGIATLLDYSLLMRGQQEVEAPRFRMLQTVRAYALGRLLAGEDAELVREAHAQWCLDLVSAGGDPIAREIGNWMNDVETELDNIQAAISWWFERRKIVDLVDLIAQLRYFWARRGRLALWRDWLDRAMALPEAANLPLRTRAEAEHARGWLAAIQGDVDRAAVAIARAAELAAQLRDPMLDIELANAQAAVAYHRGDDEAARAFLLGGLAVAEPLNVPKLVELYHNLGAVARRMGDYAAARKYHELSIERAAPAGRTAWVAENRFSLAQIGVELGETDDAWADVASAMSCFWATRDMVGVAEALETAGAISIPDDPRLSLRMIGAARRVLEDLGYVQSVPRREQLDGYVREASVGLDPAEADALLTRGRNEIKELVQFVLHGRRPVRVTPAGTEPALAPPLERPDGIALTAREREVLRLVAEGKTNQEIADQLFISPRTAGTHVANILTKLELHSRSAAAAYALRNGLA
jgi:non-specific serine/threonine protein kinase